MDKKIIESFDASKWEIETDTGWSDILEVHKTRPFDIWTINTKNYELKCADEHIVFDEKYKEIFVMDLSVGDKIITKTGIETITNIENSNISENMYDLSIDDKNHRYWTDAILSHNSTSYTVVILHEMLFKKDIKALICSNKAAAALEIVGRIRLAYELLPQWLKCGIVSFNKSSIELSNGSRVKGIATSPDSARGESCNILCMDELAFISKNIMDDFASSVFPVISSVKGTKMIVVSTPNGTGNWFYETFNNAQLNPGGEWASTKLNWDVFPGRDEAWKLQMIETFGGGDGAIRKFAQEFENKFFGTGFSLIDNTIIRAYNSAYIEWRKDNKIKTKVFVEGYDQFSIKMVEKPLEGHVYSLGYDTAEGLGGDSSTIHVLDITDVKKLKIVAYYGNNTINPHDFSYVVAKTSNFYNHAHCLGEANGIGHTVISNLHLVYELDELINYENKKREVGMYVTNNVKVTACLFLKDNLKPDECEILSPKLIEELEYFERKQGGSARTTFAASSKHDDYVMSFVWAYFSIFSEIAENYWLVTYENDKLGNPAPVAFKDYIPHFNSKDNIDSKFKTDIKLDGKKQNAIENNENSGTVHVFDEDSIGQSSNNGWTDPSQGSSHVPSANEMVATFKF